MLMFPDSNNKAFKANYEINYSDLQFDRKLSEGGYGIVYRGRWKHTTVAIKEIKREIIEQDKLEEFKNECAVMEVIRHPNVVLFLGACTKQPNLCIILEFCSRGSLWSLLHDLSIKMNWEYRKKFALDIAKGVYYLHTNKQPILHRDLKSLNVLLDQALNCKLADFGWTRVLGKVMTSKIGTYQWMAPEVIHGFKYTEKADVFSFGVILWELATRKPPYYGIDG
jgi:mitogen-activated protein kinase kinase kinase 9